MKKKRRKCMKGKKKKKIEVHKNKKEHEDKIWIVERYNSEREI